MLDSKELSILECAGRLWRLPVHSPLGDQWASKFLIMDKKIIFVKEGYYGEDYPEAGELVQSVCVGTWCPTVEHRTLASLRCEY